MSHFKSYYAFTSKKSEEISRVLKRNLSLQSRHIASRNSKLFACTTPEATGTWDFSRRTRVGRCKPKKYPSIAGAMHNQEDQDVNELISTGLNVFRVVQKTKSVLADYARINFRAADEFKKLTFETPRVTQST